MLNKEKVFVPGTIDERDASIALLQIPGLGNKRFFRLRKGFGSALDVWRNATKDNLSSYVPPRVASSILMGPNLKKLTQLKNTLRQMGAWLMFFDDPDFPRSLKQIDNPPALIFGMGHRKSLCEKCIAIVGSRKASTYGLKVCAYLAGALVKEGFTIVSGLALGIDSCAHKAALDYGGLTVAVKGCGLDVGYPQKNVRLSHRIVDSGAVITEFFPGVIAEPGNFPARNRIISGLSLGVIVVEAGVKSGSLITAYLALEQGKEVMAIPGNIYSYGSKGCHKLIKEGAALVESVNDVLDALNLASVAELGKGGDENLFTRNALSQEAAIIVDKLKAGPQHIDEIASGCSISVSKVASILLELELKNVTTALGNGMYSLKNIDE